MAICPSPEAQTGALALASVQPRLCGFDQGRPSLGRVVNARCFRKTTVVIHDDAASASSGGQCGAAGVDGWKAAGDVQAHDAAGSSATRGSCTMVRDSHENVVLLERSVVKL